MKVVTGDFGKSKTTELSLAAKIERAVDKINQEVGNNAHGTFILLTETDGAIQCLQTWEQKSSTIF